MFFLHKSFKFEVIHNSVPLQVLNFDSISKYVFRVLQFTVVVEISLGRLFLPLSEALSRMAVD